MPEGDWMAPWFAAVAITAAWLTLVIVTHVSARNRENRMQSFTARLRPAEGLDEVQLTTEALTLDQARTAAERFAAEMGAGWVVDSVNVTGLLPESSPFTTYVGRNLTA
jgi:hypothetical protein